MFNWIKLPETQTGKENPKGALWGHNDGPTTVNKVQALTPFGLYTMTVMANDVSCFRKLTFDDLKGNVENLSQGLLSPATGTLFALAECHFAGCAFEGCEA